jgi:iron complex transport system ATP-binding protein
MSLLCAESLAIGYGRRQIAGGLALRLEAGGVTCLLGPNGVGKTTLFKTLLGLLPPLAGVIRLGGDDMARLPRATIARRLAYVPQSYAADFSFTVLDLVAMGRTAYLGAFATPGRRDLEISMTALEMLGIAGLAHRDAGLLSGGERQLALIARALAQQAPVVVMDEPTASLDLGNRVRVLDRIGRLAGEGLAVLLSTHEPEHALALADQVAVLGRDGRFDVGVPETILTSERLSGLYGVALQVECTASGRKVVSAAAKSRDPIRLRRLV